MRSIICVLFLFSNVLLSQKKEVQDHIMNHQTANILTSISDGQPAPAKQLGITVSSVADATDGVEYQLSLGYTPSDHKFWRNTMLQFTVPTMRQGQGALNFEKSVGISWSHRWHAEQDGIPTISTISTVQLPYDEPGEKTDLVNTLVIAKNIGERSVAYINAYAETVRGIALDAVELGYLLGYKYFLNPNTALFLNGVYHNAADLVLETALQVDIAGGWTISPGISLNLSQADSDATISAGIMLFYEFQKPLGKIN
ncbi:MAG: hypothetical protein HKN61_06215 [Flavobacteriaceae bacterium]|nr:hypothetical protein [Flavobacteriaceae bacterium]